MLQTLDTLLDTYSVWIDTIALVFVVVLALKRRDLIGLVVLIDFAVTIIGYMWIKSLPFWPNINLDYQYVFGIKDALVAVVLFLMAANPRLTIAYILGSISCWVVWFLYLKVYQYQFDYDLWLKIFYAWSPAYLAIMFLECYGLAHGDSNAGKTVRRRIIPVDWDRIFQPVNRIIYARIATFDIKVKRALK